MLTKIAIVITAVAAMAAGFWIAQTRSQPETGMQQAQFQGRVLSPARKISMPPLVRDDGSVFDQQSVTGHWSLLFFGYTNCPDICPMTLSVMAKAKKQYQGEFPQVVFVSVDPSRDTLDILGEYVRYFDPAFTAVTGEPEMLKALSLQLSVVYMPVPVEQDGEETYLVEHSSSILLLNPQGELQAFLQAPHSPASILDSLDKVLH